MLGQRLARWGGWASRRGLRSDPVLQESCHSRKEEVRRAEALEDLR